MKRTLICTTIAAMVAVVPVYVGITHNPMGEFCSGGNLDECSLDWSYALQLWLSWFVALSAAQIIAFSLVKIMKLLIFKRTKC
jgi:hypothetical protein